MTAWTPNGPSAAPPAYEATTTASVAACTRARADGSSEVLITLTPPLVPPEATTRVPVDIVCVIDVSSSMAEPATLPAEPGTVPEITELCILDVVKHALRTIITCLNADDRIAIVTFSSRASIDADLTFMDDAGKRSVNTIVSNLRPSGSTNLWDGLKTGMDLLNPTARATLAANGSIPTSWQLPAYAQRDTSEQRVASVFLLTDGAPNVTPPRGHIPMIQKYLAANPLLNFSINTFGFGYALDSQLLLHIAEVGGGTYGFVPDLGFIGTVFVHALANTLATFAVRCAIQVEYDGSALELAVLGEPFIEFEKGMRVEPDLTVLHITVGELQYGQSRDFVITARPLKPLDVSSDTPLLNILATSHPWTRDRPLTTVTTINASQLAATESSIANSRILNEVQRISFAATLLSFFSRDMTSDLLLQKAPPSTPSHESQTFIAFEKLVQDLVDQQHSAAADAEGQARMALEAPHWARWGRHYLPSLARAHLRQRCGNFRDAGQMVYGSGSPLFIHERDRADEAFDKLPPPRPTSRADHTGWAGSPRQRGGQRTQVHSMAVWNSRVGPCFSGSCAVRLATSGEIRVDQLTRGTIVATPAGPRAVVAVVRTPTVESTLLCSLGHGLKITPWHPVFVEGEWRFPADLVAPAVASEAVCDAVYSVLLEPSPDSDAHAAWIGDVLCVTLGGGAQDGPRYHPFLSDYARVLRSLSQLPGWENPAGILRCIGTTRSCSTGLICGFAGGGERQMGRRPLYTERGLSSVLSPACA